MTATEKSVLSVTLLLFYYFFFISSAGINTSNDGGHFALASAIVHNGSVSVEPFLGSYVSEPDYAIKNGKTLSDRLPGTALLMMPFIAYSKLLCNLGISPPQSINVGIQHSNTKIHQHLLATILLTNLTGTLALLLLFFLLFRTFKIPFWISFFSLVICGTATLLHLESSHLFSHSISLLLVSYAIYLTLQTQNTNSSLILASTFVGVSVLVELQNILFLFPIGIYIFTSDKQSFLASIKSHRKSIAFSSGVVIIFLAILVGYNYIAFDEIMLKSNKYNPFFPEEKSFFTALSGNLLDGLDHLFTSFQNFEANYRWINGTQNNIQGYFAANPIFIFSALGFILLYKTYKSESLLLLSCIGISVLIAALHVTTLTRHIYTIHLLLFLPIGFSIQWIMNRPLKIRNFYLTALLFLFVYSLFKQQFITLNYWGRNGETRFPFLGYTYHFVLFNIPILIGLVIYIARIYLTRSKTSAIRN